MTNLLYKNTAENLTEILSRIEKGKVESLEGVDLKNYLAILDLCEAIYDATSQGMISDVFEIGDEVLVTLTNSDPQISPFLGHVSGFKSGLIVVQDQDNEAWDCDPSEVSFYDENEYLE